MEKEQQPEVQLKQTVRVTLPSATVGCPPVNQPGTFVPQLYCGTHDVGIILPAAPSNRNQLGPSALSHRERLTLKLELLLSSVRLWYC